MNAFRLPRLDLCSPAVNCSLLLPDAKALQNCWPLVHRYSDRPTDAGAGKLAAVAGYFLGIADPSGRRILFKLHLQKTHNLVIAGRLTFRSSMIRSKFTPAFSTFRCPTAKSASSKRFRISAASIDEVRRWRPLEDTVKLPAFSAGKTTSPDTCINWVVIKTVKKALISS